VDEVAVSVGGLRREGEVDQDAPVRSGFEYRACHPCGDDPVVEDALRVGGRLHPALPRQSDPSSVR
jgi:hypothetical protein